MPWSNLSLAESKYRLFIARSKIWQYGLIVEFIVATLGLCYLLANLPLVVRVISIVCLLAVLVYWQKKSPVHANITFEIDLLGHCQWPNLVQCQLSTQSKVAWWGCYLHFQPLSEQTFSEQSFAEKSSLLSCNVNGNNGVVGSEKTEEEKLNGLGYPHALMVIKDSMNERDYARLCRIINRDG